MNCKPDRWLAEMMGQPVFKVDGLPGPDWKPVAGFYFAKVPCHDTPGSERLQQHNFRVVDTAVTFLRRAAAACQLPPQECTAEEQDSVLELARTSFRYSRFHLDPRVSNALADEIKREWVANYFRGRRGNAVLVARREGRPVGFLAALIANSGERVIDLVAVAPAWQGKGVGGELLGQFSSWAGTHPCLVGTQAANLPSIKLYQRHGFELHQTQHVLHLHVGGDSSCAL